MSGDLFYAGLLQGLVLALVAFAVMIPFRLLNFPDLTAEGGYPLGGAVCAGLLLLNVPPVFALIMASLAAGLLGLAGIILSTMMYSVNLRLMGRPNLALFHTSSMFSQSNMLVNIFFLMLLLISLIFLMILFLRTEFGLKLRAVGLNKAFACRQGISVEKYTVFGLFLAGCFTGISGGLVVQLQHYMDVGMGVGIVIHALAALMIGEAILGNNSIAKQVSAPCVGALVYQQIQGLVLSLGLTPSDLKFFTGSLVLIVIAMQRGTKQSTKQRELS